MRLFRFDIDTSQVITQHDSHNAAISDMLEIDAPCSIICIHLGAGGILGGHEAATNQLFLIVSGQGWLATAEGQTVNLQTGMAIFWEAGEWHESGTHNGLMAIVIEGDEIDPSQYMQELS
jgi:quercetin dioxygenase-like cupin family protein